MEGGGNPIRLHDLSRRMEYKEAEGGRGGEWREKRRERCTTTKYDAVVGTRLTPSKNDRRCLPCFLRASQFPTSSWPFLAAVIPRCYCCSAADRERHPIPDAVTSAILQNILCSSKSSKSWRKEHLHARMLLGTFRSAYVLSETNLSAIFHRFDRAVLSVRIQGNF